MPRPPQDVTDAELALLELLWERGRATVRELAEHLYEKAAASQQATVQKLLERLESKGCVRCDRQLWPHVYTAEIERSELVRRQLQQTADKLCAGSLKPLLVHLVQAGRLSAKDRQSLQTLLDELNGPKKGRKKR